MRDADKGKQLNHTGLINRRKEGAWVYPENHKKTLRGVRGAPATLMFPMTLKHTRNTRYCRDAKVLWRCLAV